MLERYEDEIPKLDELVDEIRQMLRDPENSLVDIREKIFYHIFECPETDLTDDEKASKASTLSFKAVDDLIKNLEVNEMNYKRIKDHISAMDSLDGYERLISDFKDFMSEEERERLIKEAKRIFPGITEHWT